MVILKFLQMSCVLTKETLKSEILRFSTYRPQFSLSVDDIVNIAETRDIALLNKLVLLRNGFTFVHVFLF